LRQNQLLNRATVPPDARLREASNAKHPALLAVIVVLMMPVLAARTVKWTFFLRGQSAVHAGKPVLGRFPPSAELSRVPGTGSSLLVNNKLLVGPFPWEEELWGKK
jgi:hypothetical protein